MNKTISMGPYSFEASRLEKLLFPDDGISKADLMHYYREIAPLMLPHLKERPLSLQRFPDGISEEGFYEKKAPEYFPRWIKRVSVKVKGKNSVQQQVVCAHAVSLVYLAEQACITLHGWLSRAGALEKPDRMIFDLDPPSEGDFELVRSCAQEIRALLEIVNLISFVMTTGSKGLHVVVPLQPKHSFETVRGFAARIAALLSKEHPKRYTDSSRKEKRSGRLFVDYLRNAYAQTAVVPYAVRPKPGAPVATPIDWPELDDTSLHAQRYTMNNIFRRLGQRDDAWKNMGRHARTLTRPLELLERRER